MSTGRLPLLFLAGLALVVLPAELGGVWSRACCAVAAVAVLVSAVRPRSAGPTVAVGAVFLAWVLQPDADTALLALLEGLLALVFLVVVQVLATAPLRGGRATSVAIARQVGPAVIAGGVGGCLTFVMTAANPPDSVWWVLAGMAALPAAYFVAVRPFGRTTEEHPAIDRAGGVDHEVQAEGRARKA